LIVRGTKFKNEFSIANFSADRIYEPEHQRSKLYKKWVFDENKFSFKNYAIGKDMNQKDLLDKHNYLVMRDEVDKIILVEFDSHLNMKSQYSYRMNNSQFLRFNTDKTQYRVQLAGNKVYIFQNYKKNWKSTIFVLHWKNVTKQDAPNKFSGEPEIEIIKLKKYYDDCFYGRFGRFNFLKRYKGLYAMEITKKPNISEIPVKKMIRLRVPNSEEKPFRLIESGFGTFVIKSPKEHMSIVHRRNRRIGVKAIPIVEYPTVKGVLNKFILV
jgi:hypothetical protein